MFSNTSVTSQSAIETETDNQSNDPDTGHISQTIDRFAWLAGIATSLIIPLLILGYGFVSQYKSISNEAVMLSSMIRQHQQSNVVDDEKNAIKQMVKVASTNSENEITLRPDNTSDRSRFLEKSAVIYFTDGTSAVLTLSRMFDPVLINAIWGLIPGGIIGFLVFWISQTYPHRVLSIAISELTRRTEAEQRLRAANSLFSAILESTAEGIVAIDGEGRVVAYNTRYIELWKLSANECKHDSDYILFSSLAAKIRDSKSFLERNQKLLSSPTTELTACLELLDGRTFEWTSRPQRIQGKVVGRISTFRDISESRRAEILLSTENAVLEKIVHGSPLEEALFVVADAIERESGDMFCAILFCTDGRRNQLNVVTGSSLPDWYCDRLLKLEPSIGKRKNDASCINTNKPCYWFETHPYQKLMQQIGVNELKLELIHGSKGEIIGVVLAHYRSSHVLGFGQDDQLLSIASQMCSIAIDRYHSTQELDLLAHYDFLTELPNRKHFHDQLNKAIERAKNNQRLLGLLFLDLDRFKAVNDSLGHAAGDDLLRVVASRLRECVRDHDIVARLGGDEFVILVEDIQDTETAASLACKIAERMTESVSLNGHETFISTSIGIAIYPNDGNTLEELLKNADAAMYEVKGQGRNGMQFFHSSMNEGGLERLQMEGQLRRALDRNEMALHYQPKVNAQTLEVIGAEALLRWHHPIHGLVPPSKFVPLLEDTGMIVEFGEWIIQQACEDLLQLKQIGRTDIDIAINISARQFGKSNLCETLVQVINNTGISPKTLILELTESLLMKEPDQARQIIQELRDLGIGGIAIDDFGTGYSSLAYLKGFPITSLKIDRSFVSGIAHSRQDEAIAQAIIALAKNLNLKVTAEGVETNEQISLLTAKGCDEFQGYYFGRPVPFESFRNSLGGGLRLIRGKSNATSEEKPSQLVLKNT